MKQINKKIFKMIPAGLYFGLIWHLSSQEVPVDISGNDKIFHLIEYSAMGFFLAFGLNMTLENLKQTGRNFLILAPLTGAIDEIHQGFVPGRVASGVDFVVDIFGCAIGLTFFLILVKILMKYRLIR